MCLGHPHAASRARSDRAGQVKGIEVRQIRGSGGYVTHLGYGERCVLFKHWGAIEALMV